MKKEEEEEENSWNWRVFKTHGYIYILETQFSHPYLR